MTTQEMTARANAMFTHCTEGL